MILCQWPTEVLHEETQCPLALLRPPPHLTLSTGLGFHPPSSPLPQVLPLNTLVFEICSLNCNQKQLKCIAALLEYGTTAQPKLRFSKGSKIAIGIRIRKEGVAILLSSICRPADIRSEVCSSNKSSCNRQKVCPGAGLSTNESQSILRTSTAYPAIDPPMASLL